MKDLTYNSSDNIVKSFNKNDVWSRSFLSMSRFYEDRITFQCDNQKYQDAMELVKVGNERWSLRINWSQVDMNQVEEVFNVDIKYSDIVKLSEKVKVTYPQRNVSVDDFDFGIVPEEGKWGTEGELCKLVLKLKKNIKQWMLNETQYKVHFKLTDNKGFTTLTEKDTVTLNSHSAEIPLRYVGYDNPINKNYKQNVLFAINDIDCPKPPVFTFTPRPYSYEAIITDLKNSYQYGSEDRKICQIQLKRTHELSPIAKSIEILSLSPNSFLQSLECSHHEDDITKWDVVVKSDASYRNLKDLENKQLSIVLGLDKKECYCTAVFSLGSIKKGVEPVIRMEPVGGLNSFRGDKEDICKLTVINKCQAKITVNKVNFKSIPDGLISIKEKAPKEIVPQGDIAYTITVKKSQSINVNAQIVVSTNETEQVSLNYPIIIEQRPDAIISIQPIKDGNGKKYVGQKYEKNSQCIRCEIGYASDSSKDSVPIDMSTIDFGENFCLDLSSFKDTVIPNGEKREVDLLFNNDFCVHKEEIQLESEIQEDGSKPKTHLYIPCNWKYKSQEGDFQIPFAYPKLYNGEKALKNAEIVFPLPGEERVVQVMTIVYQEMSEKDKDICWDTNQKLTTESPFSFSESGIETECNIIPGKSITFYLHINEIEGIDDGTHNINEEKIIERILKKQSDNRPSKEKNFSIKLKPIEAQPQRRLLFRTNKQDVQLKRGIAVPVPIQIQPQSQDVEAQYIGQLVVKNEQEISFKDNGVRLKLKSLAINCQGMEMLHDKTKDEVPRDIEILNGQQEVCIPIYLKAVEASKGGTPLLRIDFESYSSSEDGSQQEMGEEVSYGAKLLMQYDFVDDVYALDLGTTGIVIAKDTGDEPKCVILEDTKNPIEKDPEILSAHTMITYRAKTNESIIELAPEINEYYSKLEDTDGNKKFRLVPSKFIIGQDHIPFLSTFYNSKEIPKTVKAFESNKGINLSQNIPPNEKEGSISILIASMYREIFSRCGQEVTKIKKLIVTYPNTYTIENLDRLELILKERLDLKLRGQISFVPESDAVAAYYFYQKIIFDHGLGHDKESVVIYDMGAGTLDLSLVTFEKVQDGIVASIINKIGIPLAGNYLDYIIFNTLLKDKWLKPEVVGEDGSTSKIADKPNTIKNLTTEIKKDFSNKNSIGSIDPDWLRRTRPFFEDRLNELNQKTYMQLIGENNMSFNDFLKACSETALKCLIPEGTEVQTIVFSGRGSQFAPLRARVKEELEKLMSKKIREDKLEPLDNCGDFLKTCVALGALQHQTFISSDGQFQMVNKNLFSKIAVVYYGYSDDGNYDVNVRFLVEPLQENWEDVEVKNGTRCKEFYAEDTISNHMPGDMYYIQTCLPEKDLKELYGKVYRHDPSAKDDLNWAFVNLLFKKRVKGNQPIPIKLKVSKDNKIVEREIGGDILTDKKLLENIEDNIIYRRSMWPFIVTELK